MIAGLFLALLTVPAAQASYDPLGGGTTKLELDKRFLGFLARDHVRLQVGAPATFGGGTLSLPVSGGSLDPTTGRGEIEHEGALILRDARRRVPIRSIVVKTTHAPLVAKVGGSQLKLATAAKAASRREGFGAVFSAKPLKLTAKVATRLNKKLRPPLPFAAGQEIGTLVSAPQPTTVAILPTGRATVVFDPAFLAKLNELFVSVNPIFPAEHQGGTFTFPIVANGALAPDGSSGTLRTGGDVEFLKLGSGQVFWHEPWFDLGGRQVLADVDVEPSPTLPGKVGQLAVASLAGGGASADPAARTVSLGGATLALTATAAGQLNLALAGGEAKFQAGETIGSLSFTALAQ